MPPIQARSIFDHAGLGPAPLCSPLRRLREWELVELIATGELCEIYRARPAGAPADHAAHGARPAGYAVKLLRSHWENDPGAVSLLRREASVGRQIADAHVIAVLSAEVVTAPYFLVMPYLVGETLRTRLVRQSLCPLHWSLWVARQAATGLAALGSRGWMHGDVKPANLLVSPEGHVTLLDLGFARRPGELNPAGGDYLLGTAQYMAPELLSHRMRSDIRSDIYSLGAVLFELLAGRPPFVGAFEAQIVRQHKEAVPARLERIAPHVPAEVASLVQQMLAKDPLRRPQTPAELVERLTALEILAIRQWTAE